MRTLVTGATGLVGSHLVERLLEREDSVRALVRDPRRAEPLARLGAELFAGDLHQPCSLEQAAEDMEVVYHCAAQVTLPYQGNRSLLLQTNVEGTRNLLKASVRAGVQRFVLTSSVAVYGEPQTELIHEGHPLCPHDAYSESKILTEQLLQEYTNSLQTVILRPCVIYGPRDNNFLPQLSRLLPRLRFPLVNGGHQPLDMVYVTDVADALVLAGTKEEAVGQAYNVTDGQRHSIRELVTLFSQFLHRPLRTLSIPYPVAYSMAALSYAWSRLRRPGEQPLISPRGVRAMAQPHHYDISKIQRELGYAPRVRLEEGLKQAVEWYLGLK